MARPRKNVDERIVESAIAHGNTVEDASVILGVSKDTLERRFAECIERGRAKMRSSLRKRQYQLAMGGNVGMLVWLGKNLLGQRDKMEHTGADGGPIRHDVTRNQTAELMADPETRMAAMALSERLNRTAGLDDVPSRN